MGTQRAFMTHAGDRALARSVEWQSIVSGCLGLVDVAPKSIDLPSPSTQTTVCPSSAKTRVFQHLVCHFIGFTALVWPVFGSSWSLPNNRRQNLRPLPQWPKQRPVPPTNFVNFTTTKTRITTFKAPESLTHHHKFSIGKEGADRYLNPG